MTASCTAVCGCTVTSALTLTPRCRTSPRARPRSLTLTLKVPLSIADSLTLTDHRREMGSFSARQPHSSPSRHTAARVLRRARRGSPALAGDGGGRRRGPARRPCIPVKPWFCKRTNATRSSRLLFLSSCHAHASTREVSATTASIFAVVVAGLRFPRSGRLWRCTARERHLHTSLVREAIWSAAQSMFVVRQRGLPQC